MAVPRPVIAGKQPQRFSLLGAAHHQEPSHQQPAREPLAT
jgi:hypothetical protein